MLKDAVTGFIVHSEDQAVEAVHRIGMLDRARVRSEFERRFTAHRMAQDYLKLYARLAQARRSPILRVETGREELHARSRVASDLLQPFQCMTAFRRLPARLGVRP